MDRDQKLLIEQYEKVTEDYNVADSYNAGMVKHKTDATYYKRGDTVKKITPGMRIRFPLRHNNDLEIIRTGDITTVRIENDHGHLAAGDHIPDDRGLGRNHTFAIQVHTPLNDSNPTLTLVDLSLNTERPGYKYYPGQR